MHFVHIEEKTSEKKKINIICITCITCTLLNTVKAVLDAKLSESEPNFQILKTALDAKLSSS